MKKGNKESCLIGIKGGEGDIFSNDYIEITDDLMDMYRNIGGFNIMDSRRTKIEIPDQFAQAYKVITELN